ncbi:MAG: thiolase domain-containing protein, partial [Candidatus Bipolaricaulota bacterium]|nr:thiolase domain-containing protein [Candidatus Bipolaricaulota bacterium]
MDLKKIRKDVAVVGAGMTVFARRLQETGKEMSWEAARMALDEAGLTLKDIDAVIMGSAPDAFDGVHKKGEYLLDGAGGTNKPYMRVFIGGGTAVFAPIAGWWHVASGMFQRVLVVCEEKMSSVQPHAQSAFGHIWDPILDRPLKPNLVWIFSMEMQRYMYKYNVRYEDIALV